MKLKTQLLIGVLVIFLTIGCVSAEEDTTISNSPADTVNTYNITSDSYSTYFNDNGNLKDDSGINAGDILKLGNLTDKKLFLNKSLNIQKLDDDSQIENTVIVLFEDSKNTNITGLTIVNNLEGSYAIVNYASDVTIENNNILLKELALSAIYTGDAYNVKISNNTITLNNNANISSTISVFNSTKSNISNNIILGNAGNLSAIVLYNGKENILEKNSITVQASNIEGICLFNEDNDYLVNNTINSTEDGLIGIHLINSTSNTVIENEVYSTCGNTIDSYAIEISGENNNITRNVIEGTNLNGIITESNNTNLIFNLIILSSDENLHVGDNNKSELAGIITTSSNNQIDQNVVISLNDTADSIYAIGVVNGDDENPAKNNTISNSQIYMESLSPDVHGIYVTDVNDCVLDSNFVFLQSDGMVYGFSSEPVVEEELSNFVVSNNIIVGRGNDVRLIEVLFANNYTIVNNTLIGEGDGAYGVAGENVTNTTISNNTINVTGNGTGNNNKTKTNDPIPKGTSAVVISGKSKDDKVTNNTLVSNTNVTVSNTTENITVENNTNEISTNITVGDTIIIEGTGSNFTGKLLALDGTPIVGHHLSINLTRVSNGLWKVYDLVSDYKGEFSIPINLASGDYTAKLEYAGLTLGNNIYTPSESEKVNIKVVKEYDNRTGTIINVQPLTKQYNTDVSFTGTFKDTNGNVIIGHHLNVKLSRLSSGASKTYDVVTDYTGTFKIPINLAPGAYSAEVSYDGTPIYQPTTAGTVAITVTA